MTADRSNTLAPIALLAGFALFLAVLAFAVVSAFSRPNVVEFALTPVRARPPVDTLVVDTLTVDARDAARWTFVDLARGSVVYPPDTAGWSLAVRRFDIVPSGGATDLGPVEFESVRQLPLDRFVPSEFHRDTLNDALDRWYNYSFTTHVMSPNGHVFGVRTRDQRYATLEILSYYCPGVVAGCLTFRYAYQPSGDPSVAPDRSPG